MKRLVLWIALGLLISLASVPAGAEDFTFNVPVELHKIPAAIPTFVVSVSVYDAPPDAGGHWGERVAAGDSGGIALVNGEYVGLVIVKFNTDWGKDPTKARAYRVDLLLYGPPHYEGGCLNAMGLSTPYPYDATQPIVCYLTGPISPPSAPAPTKKSKAALRVSPSPNVTKRPTPK